MRVPVIACCRREFERFRANRQGNGIDYRYATDIGDIRGYSRVVLLPIHHAEGRKVIHDVVDWVKSDPAVEVIEDAP